MKKRFFGGLALMLVIVLSICVVSSPVSAASVTPSTMAQKDNDVLTVADNNYNDMGVAEARFLNMLNHNFVYNKDFANKEILVNNSMIAILNLRDEDNDSYISEKNVSGFINDMYGVVINDYSAINADCPKLDGFVYIIPRGFTTYKHTIDSIAQNEDGSYTVTTNVLMESHDGAPINCKAVSLFVKNEQSSFGYNIIYSNLIENTSSL